jgi:hypothetical protein
MSFPEYPHCECGEESCAAQMPVRSFGHMILEICVLLEDGADKPSNRQVAVLESLNQLSPKELLEEIAIAARNYYREVDAEVGLAEEGVQIDDDRIDTHYRFSDITIPQHNECDTDFVLIGMNCDWEEEHGMHVLLADGHVVYCGSCATLFYGGGWKRVISANERESRTARLNELLAAVPR